MNSAPCNWPPAVARTQLIGAWVLIVLVVGAAGALGIWHQWRLRMLESARIVTRHELLAHHWKHLEFFKDFTRSIDDSVRGDAADVNDRRWAARFPGVPAKPRMPLDEFETQAAIQLEAGANEVWRAHWSGTARYVRAVRARTQCLVCHPVDSAGRRLQDNDIIGLVSLELTSGDSRRSTAVAATDRSGN